MIGPITISVISISRGKVNRLSRAGVRDSKLLTGKKRMFLYDEIQSLAEEVLTYSITNSEINQAMSNHISINELEALNFAKLIDSMESKPSTVFLDSPDVISERFGLRVGFFSQKRLLASGMKRGKKSAEEDVIKVISEHKADSRYPVVSGASIIAKVERDREIQRIADRSGLDIGSGYPSDSYTVSAIREDLGRGRLAPYLRERWQTIKAIRQLRMEEFLG
ncbi:MAG: ribonuclease HII [Candidatus Marsarchaeota archaeon]|nr:ribonuclease HII [Candidatus Marsarchaeota archaeon]